MLSETAARLVCARRLAGNMTARGIAMAAVLGLVACIGRESESRNESTTTVEAADSAKGIGRGHLHLTGDATVDTDFTVEQCAIGPPGDGLLSGYHMNAKSSHGTLEMLSVAVKDYEKDGIFSPAAEAMKGLTAGKHRLAGPLTIMVNRSNSTIPLAVIPKPESRLTITISDGGASGSAEFTDMTSPIAMEDIDIKARGRTKGKTFSGSLTWRCASIAHVDPRLHDAAKGMMQGLTPIH
jgi:hypothetical protein